MIYLKRYLLNMMAAAVGIADEQTRVSIMNSIARWNGLKNDGMSTMVTLTSIMKYRAAKGIEILKPPLYIITSTLMVNMI